MAEIVEVENSLDADWKRVLHLMSNEEIVAAEIENPLWCVPEYAKVSYSFEAGVHHMRAEWEPRGAFVGTMYFSDRRERQVVIWAMQQGERISEVAVKAAKMFAKIWGRSPSFVAVSVYPQGAEDDCDIDIGDGYCVALVQCKDVRDKFLMLF